MLHCQ